MAAEYSVRLTGYEVTDSHTQYHVEVSDLQTGATWEVVRRYREFRDLHEHMKLKYNFSRKWTRGASVG